MSSGFISETEIAERRRIRQEEWDRVRQPDQPKEAPEEEYDARSLFERLQEQKQKKDLEYEEAHKLKNMVKGLDDDEIEFLDYVDKKKLEEERIKAEEEAKEMADFRVRVASLQEASLEARLMAEVAKPKLPPKPIGRSTRSQTSLLVAAVKRKSCDTQGAPGAKKCVKEEAKESNAVANDTKKENESNRPVVESKPDDSRLTSDSNDASGCSTDPSLKKGSLTCIGILPGLGFYGNSSDEDDSEASSDIEDYQSRLDLLGRKIQSRKVAK